LWRRAKARYDGISRQVLVLPNYLTKFFPIVLLVCNVGAAVCCAAAGDFKRSIYWAASALCICAISF
jgi:hypothetical protein